MAGPAARVWKVYETPGNPFGGVLPIPGERSLYSELEITLVSDYELISSSFKWQS